MNRKRVNFCNLFRRAIVLGALLFLTACQSELYSNLSELDANEMIQVLQDAGIDATRGGSVEGAFSIKVDRSEFSLAVAKLAQKGLPRKQYGSLGEVFQGNKLVSTPFEERARFMHAMNQELENSISQISGVVSARVHLMVPDDKPFAQDRDGPRASVFIYKNPEANLRELVPTIKDLIVNSLDGLTYDKVEVAIFDSARAIDGDEASIRYSRNSMFNQMIMLGVLCAVIVAGAVFLAYLKNKEKERRKRLEQFEHHSKPAVVPGE